MTDVLKLVLTDHWFEEIKSGRKTHEYRQVKPYWISKIYGCSRETARCINLKRDGFIMLKGNERIEFQKAYRKNAEKMLFSVKSLSIHNGKDTDLKIDDFVFDFELGERIR